MPICRAATLVVLDFLALAQSKSIVRDHATGAATQSKNVEVVILPHAQINGKVVDTLNWNFTAQNKANVLPAKHVEMAISSDVGAFGEVAQLDATGIRYKYFGWAPWNQKDDMPTYYAEEQMDEACDKKYKGSEAATFDALISKRIDGNGPKSPGSYHTTLKCGKLIGKACTGPGSSSESLACLPKNKVWPTELAPGGDWLACQCNCIRITLCVKVVTTTTTTTITTTKSTTTKKNATKSSVSPTSISTLVLFSLFVLHFS